MSLTTWALERLRAELPHEPIFDGPRSAATFDGVPVPPEARRLIVVHTVGPRHKDVTLAPSERTPAFARVRLIVHTFALSRREVDERRKAIWRALRYRVPTDPSYEWSYPEHEEARGDDPDLTLVAPQLHAIDEFAYAGFEK